MSQDQLASAVRRPQGVISEWENGHRRADMTDLWGITEALRCTLEELIGPPRTADEVERYAEFLSRPDVDLDED